MGLSPATTVGTLLPPGNESGSGRQIGLHATATGAYDEAAALACKWGCLAAELAPQRAASQLAVFMLDGWQARYRGPGWGKKKTQKNRVEWHEVKMGIFYLAEQAGRTEGGRGVLTDKVVVCWQGEPAELGGRLHGEALRRGLGRVQWILVVGDGAPWIWNVAADRWANAQEWLDFYHASEHLWELGRALYGEEQAKDWVEARLHELRHGQEETFLARLAELKAPRGKQGEVVAAQKKYFANQSERMNYQEIAQRGWPIGSGAVESACSGEQNRFKGRGQFWTRAGLGHLAALQQARQNHYWDELWFAE